MNMTMAGSKSANDAYEIVRNLQEHFVNSLDSVSKKIGENKPYEEVIWFRDEGLHGGGSRYEARDMTLFNTASVNVSQVHYDENPDKNLKSATAISSIIHPKNPHVPSIHIHFSLTELRDGKTYWRLMADLNPSIKNDADKKEFTDSLKALAPEQFEEAKAQGDKYFNIPSLNRHRGVSHFYLENYNSGNEEADKNLVLKVARGVIDTYTKIIENAYLTRKEITEEDIQKQLEYHTLYLFQVLTLDRGTTSGLLVHSQNDVGIMGSLPAFIDKSLLNSWASKVPDIQKDLVIKLALAIDKNGRVDEDTKQKLARVVREHYTKNKDALALQASGNSIPDTVGNHAK